MFFDVNTFTVRSVDKMTTTLAQLRHLQFAGKAALDICHRYLRPLDVVFRTASLLPQLRTITVPCDELAQDDQKTVRGVLCSQSQGNEFDLRCIDVGLFEVTPAVKVNCKIYFENIGLRRMLPQAKQYATEYQPGRLADLERAENSKPYAERLEKQERASIGCGIWFQYYELMRVKREGDAAAFTRWLAAPEQEGMRFYVQDWFADSESVPWISPLLPNGVKMLDLIVEGCTSRSPELLEWASEYMSLNVYTGRIVCRTERVVGEEGSRRRRELASPPHPNHDCCDRNRG